MRFLYVSIIVLTSFVLTSFVILSAAPAYADCYVSGYYTSRGTWVKGYYRTCPDGTPLNNYSTKGNYNPYTGQNGYIDPLRDSYRSRSSWGSSDSYSGSGYRQSYRNNDSYFTPRRSSFDSYQYDSGYRSNYRSRSYSDPWSSYYDPYSFGD